MRPFWADLASSPQPARIHPALIGAADEIYATLSRLSAYVGTLALIAMLAVHFWDELPQMVGGELQPGARLAAGTPALGAWSVADRNEKSGAYTTLQDPEGPRKQVFACAGSGDRPIRRIEIDRTRPDGAARSGDWVAEAANPHLRGAL